MHDPMADPVGMGKKGGKAAGDVWARLRQAEARYPLRTWEATIVWLGGEIVLAREQAERDDKVMERSGLLQRWARLLIEALKHHDESKAGSVQVVFNLEHRPPETPETTH